MTALLWLLSFSDDFPNVARGFATDPWRIAVAVAVLLAGVAFVGANWWRAGRDRVYMSHIHMTDDRRERIRPLRYRPTVVIEYAPPNNLRPAQIGVLLNERPGPREFTATYADLAARGYLSIEEIPRGGMDGRPAWRMRRLRSSEGLHPFEQTLLDGVFRDGDERVLDYADTHHWDTVRRAEQQLLDDSVDARFFPAHAERVRMRWIYISAAVVGTGIALIPILGTTAQLGFAAVAVCIIGAVMFATHTWMPRRTAMGSEMVRRCLGFKLFVERGEGARHAFNEQYGLFEKYLGYAIVFGVANRWASAFHPVNTPNVLHVYVEPPKRSWSEFFHIGWFQ